ncbi:hypothetical protein ACOCEA_17420 [Maribacter sp. CXY002]|uniref:hypothetical protein n=1 Tax=Maribacter luteocoastalis TaxID=3407671 RepID=UPI003B6832ED
MKNLFLFTIMILTFPSCDPASNMEANIENLTSQTLTIEFISSTESLSKTLQIPPNGIELFQEGFDIGSNFLKPSLLDYDSVVIKNQTKQILKVFKEIENGKNIYNVDEYWIASEPSKRFFIYEYEIGNEDIE